MVSVRWLSKLDCTVLDENTVSLLEAKVSGNELGKLLSRIEFLICRLGRSLLSSVLFWERFWNVNEPKGAYEVRLPRASSCNYKRYNTKLRISFRYYAQNTNHTNENLYSCKVPLSHMDWHRQRMHIFLFLPPTVVQSNKEGGLRSDGTMAKECILQPRVYQKGPTIIE